MRPLAVALAVEARKAAAGRVTAATGTLLVLGVAAIAGGMSAAARAGNEPVLAQLGPVADLGGWHGLIAIVSQITAAGSVLAFGVALSWIVGREFADGTITGLFALPISRSTTAIAKLAVYLVWALPVAAALVLVVLLLGPLLGLGPPGPAGGWFPFAAPALWAIEPGSVSIGQLALTLAVPVVSGLGTACAWARMQLDR